MSQTLFLLFSNPFPSFLFMNIFFQAEKKMTLKMHLLLNKSHSGYRTNCIVGYKLYSFVQLYPEAVLHFLMSELFRTGFLLTQMHKIFLTGCFFFFIARHKNVHSAKIKTTKFLPQ